MATSGAANDTNSTSNTNNANDRLTVYAIAVICYFVAMLTHEGLGHAGTTLLLGGHVEQITSATCRCDTSRLTPWAARAVFAGGCVANVLTGFVALWIGTLVQEDRSIARYSTWLFGHLSLFVAAGYLMVFPFLPAGDWHDFIGGLSTPLVWKLGLTALGIVGYFATLTHAQRHFAAFLSADPRDRRKRARTLALMPYFIGGAIETLSSVVGGGGILTLISAMPATFGGTIGVPVAGMRAGSARSSDQSVALSVPRSPLIVVVGVCVALIHVFWFGPGLLRRR